jgi:hypothetical protein
LWPPSDSREIKALRILRGGKTSILKVLESLHEEYCGKLASGRRAGAKIHQGGNLLEAVPQELKMAFQEMRSQLSI